MRSLSFAFAIATLAIVCQPAALGADAERGRALYENHCVACHTSNVHRREPRVAADSAQLYKIVDNWQAKNGGCAGRAKKLTTLSPTSDSR